LAQNQGRLEEGDRNAAANKLLEEKYKQAEEAHKNGDPNAGINFLYQMKAHATQRDVDERSFDTYKYGLQATLCKVYESMVAPKSAEPAAKADTKNKHRPK